MFGIPPEDQYPYELIAKAIKHKSAYAVFYPFDSDVPTVTQMYDGPADDLKAAMMSVLPSDTVAPDVNIITLHVQIQYTSQDDILALSYMLLCFMHALRGVVGEISKLDYEHTQLMQVISEFMFEWIPSLCYMGVKFSDNEKVLMLFLHVDKSRELPSEQTIN